MQVVTVDQIDERLKMLPPEKLVVVYDFVSYLIERITERRMVDTPSEALQTMIGSEAVLACDVCSFRLSGCQVHKAGMIDDQDRTW